VTGRALFDPRIGWRKAPGVALRPEPFGALAYDFSTRRLSFLKSPALARVVEGLGQVPSVLHALDAVAVPDVERPRYLSALALLAGTGIITRRATVDEEAVS